MRPSRSESAAKRPVYLLKKCAKQYIVTQEAERQKCMVLIHIVRIKLSRLGETFLI